MPRRTVRPATMFRLGLLSPLGVVAVLTLAFSQIFGWTLVRAADFGELLPEMAEPERTTGDVTAVESTGFRVNKRMVYAVTFDHGPPDARRHATSYGPGGSMRAGQAAQIEYPAGHPERARITGMGRRPLPGWAGLIALVPLLAALVLLLIVAVLTRRRVRFLEDGIVAIGRRTAKKKTRARVNRMPVYQLVYEAVGPDGRPRRAVGHTHRLAELGENERLLCEPDGDRALLLGTLPGRPQLLPDDSIEFPASVWPGILGALLALGVGGWLAVFVIAA